LGVGQGGVAEAQGQGILGQGLHGGGALGQEGDDAGGGGEQEEGPFFEHEREPAFGAGGGQALQRPPVEHEQEAGQGDRHGFGEQAERSLRGGSPRPFDILDSYSAAIVAPAISPTPPVDKTPNRPVITVFVGAVPLGFTILAFLRMAAFETERNLSNSL